MLFQRCPGEAKEPWNHGQNQRIAPEGGETVTKTITFTGSELHLNYATSVAGSIKVALLDDTGVQIPGYEAENCFEIIGNQVARAVQWNGTTDISALTGKPIRIHFEMRDADLYALQFK